MDVFKAIKGRRSIRAFKRQAVPKRFIDKLIEAARWAPSAGNIQPWEFVVVRKPEIKHKLSAAALEQTFVEEAPVVIVVCADERRSSRGYGERGKTLYCLQDTAAAVQNIHLLAYALGLGTCWVGAFNEDAAREVLRVPENLRPIAIVPVGYPNETPKERNKRSASELIHFETF